MQEKYADKGVVLLALSDEPVSKVKGFLKSYAESANKSSESKSDKPFEFNYIIGMNAGGTTNAYNVKGYPTILVIDAKGKVTYRGHNPMEAEGEIKRLLEKDPPKETGSLVESAAKDLYKRAARYAKKDKYDKALETLDTCAEQFKDTKYGKKAEARAKKIRGNKKLMAKITAGEAEKECKDWLRLARSCAKAGQKDTAAEYYDRIIQKYPDSSHAKTAESERARL